MPAAGGLSDPLGPGAGKQPLIERNLLNLDLPSLTRATDAAIGANPSPPVPMPRKYKIGSRASRLLVRRAHFGRTGGDVVCKLAKIAFNFKERRSGGL